VVRRADRVQTADISKYPASSLAFCRLCPAMISYPPPASGRMVWFTPLFRFSAGKQARGALNACSDRLR
jgi:hypothetical protein